MSLLNVNLLVLSYEDSSKTASPRVKLADYKFDLMGMPSGTPKVVPFEMNPGDTLNAVSTLRPITYTTGTSFAVTKTGSVARLTGTFAQRASRAYGDATTSWVITQSQDVSTLTYGGVGTAPDFNTMLSGDFVTLGTPFAALNQGDFQVVKATPTSIQYINSIGSGETQVSQVQVYSQGPVQKGDTLIVKSGQFAFPNQGQFVLSRVTDLFVEFSNPDAFPESGITTVAANDITVYQFAYNWMCIASDNRIQVQMNGDSGVGIEVEPQYQNELVNNPGLFLKRGRVTGVNLINPGQTIAKGFLFLAE